MTIVNGAIDEKIFVVSAFITLNWHNHNLQHGYFINIIIILVLTKEKLHRISSNIQNDISTHTYFTKYCNTKRSSSLQQIFNYHLMLSLLS